MVLDLTPETMVFLLPSSIATEMARDDASVVFGSLNSRGNLQAGTAVPPRRRCFQTRRGTADTANLRSASETCPPFVETTRQPRTGRGVGEPLLEDSSREEQKPQQRRPPGAEIDAFEMIRRPVFLPGAPAALRRHSAHSSTERPRAGPGSSGGHLALLYSGSLLEMAAPRSCIPGGDAPAPAAAGAALRFASALTLTPAARRLLLQLRDLGAPPTAPAQRDKTRSREWK